MVINMDMVNLNFKMELNILDNILEIKNKEEVRS